MIQYRIYQTNGENQKNYQYCPRGFLCQHAVPQLQVLVFLRQQFRSVPIDLATTVSRKMPSWRSG